MCGHSIDLILILWCLGLQHVVLRLFAATAIDLIRFDLIDLI